MNTSENNPENNESKNESNESLTENIPLSNENTPLSTESNESTEKLTQISIRGKQSDKDFINQLVKECGFTTQGQALSYIIAQAQKAPETIEVEKTVTVEVTKEVPTALLPNQALITLTPETINKIRVCRPFIAQGNVLTYERGNDVSFISALVDLSINKILDKNFPAIIRRLNLKNYE